MSTLFGPATTFHNPTEFVFEPSGRVLYTSAVNNTSTHGVHQIVGGVLSLIVAATSPVGALNLDSTWRICFGGLRGAIGVLSFTGAQLNALFAASTRFAIGAVGARVDAIDAQQRLPRMDMQGVATEDCRLFRGVGSGTCPRWRAAPRGGFARATPATRSSSCLLRDRSVRPVRGRRTLEFQHAARTSAQTRDVSRTRRLARSMRFDEWGRRPARRARGGSAAEHGVQDRRALRDTRA